MMNAYDGHRDEERLSFPQRLSELIIILCLLVLFAFFVSHQTSETGFFTERFGMFEMVCLYLPLAVSLLGPAVRAWTGKRHAARPFEAVTNLLLALGSLWLLIAFPFNYAHLPDVLPGGLQFLLAWVTDGLAKFVLLLQVIIGPISAVLAIFRYTAERQREAETTYKRRTL